MHQTLILLLFLVSVYSAVHADSVRYARELRRSSGGPEHGKLKNSTPKHSVSHFPINKTSEVKGNLEKHTRRKEETKIHHTTPEVHHIENVDSEKTKGRSHSNITLTNKLHTASPQNLTRQHEKKLGKTKIPEQMKRVTEKVNAILRSTQNHRSLKERKTGKTEQKDGPNRKTSKKQGADSTKNKVKPKRKLVRKLSSGSVLTDDDERSLVDESVNNLLTDYKNCQTSHKSKKDIESCIDKAQNKEKNNIGTRLTKGNKCEAGAELEKCKDRILKKAVDFIPLSIPIDLSYYRIVASRYGKVKIGLILAKNFDNCYDKNDKSGKLVECLKAGSEKSPLIVAYDEIAKQVGDFCALNAKKEATCRAGAVGSIKVDAEAAINAILDIFCNEKDKDKNCQTEMTTTISEVVKDFDMLSKPNLIPLTKLTTEKEHGSIDLGNQLDKESDVCKKETNIDKYVDCLKDIVKKSAVIKNFAKKVADHCGSDMNSERNCRKTEKMKAETLLKKVVEALFTNHCGETEKRERGYQACLKTKLNKVSIDVQLPAPIIKFRKLPPLKDIVADAQYGKIAIGSTVGDKVKNCQTINKSWKIDDFINCLGTYEKAPLKTAMDEIGNQLTSHCAKVQSDERVCRRDGEVDVKKKIKNTLTSLFYKFCSDSNPEFELDYIMCINNPSSESISEGFSLSFKLLDEVDLSKFSRKDENGEIKIGEILKKEAESCKSFKTRDEFFNCLKGEPLKTAKTEMAKQLAYNCGKVVKENVVDCRDSSQDEVQTKLKNALDAILTNFCRDVFQKSEKEYTECLNFDGNELEILSTLDNIPATIYAITDISKFQTTEDHGGIKIGEMLQNVFVPCDGKKTLDEYFSCVSGPKGATTSPWIDITAKIGKELADVCGQKEMIEACRNEVKVEIDSKMREMGVDLLMNFCGKNAGKNQQTYTTCISSVDRKVDKLKKIVLPISLRNEVSLPSLVIAKYGNIQIGYIIQKQAGMCKNMKTLDEVVDCLKTSKGVEPSPAKAAKDSISDKFADYALQQKLGDDDWKQGVEEVRKEFKKSIQALTSNFCRDNFNKEQYSHLDCLDKGLINSEVLSQGFSPTDVFLQCSLKKTESDFNQCIDTVTSQRLKSWTASCATKQECTDAAKKSTAETSKVAHLSGRLVACKDASCIQNEKQKVIDAFTKEEEKYCKSPCKDSKARVESAVEKSFCSIDPSNLKCQAFSCPTVFDDTPCKNDGDVFKKCQNTCNQVEQSKLEKKKDGGPNYLLIVGITVGSIILGSPLVVGVIYGVRHWLNGRKNNEKPEKKKKKKPGKKLVKVKKSEKTRKKKKPGKKGKNQKNKQPGKKKAVSPPPLPPPRDPPPLPQKEIKNDEEKEEEKNDETAVATAVENVAPAQEEFPDLRNNPDRERMRDKLKRTQDNLRLLKTHANKCAKEHKRDLENNFTPMGPIYIPMEPEVPPPRNIPQRDIILTSVTWKTGLNELWEVGSDVDDIELDQDFFLNPDSVTEDETSEKSGKSKSSAKSKSKESKKRKNGTPKLDAASVPSTSGTGPSTSGLPSVPAPTPTAPTAEKPNTSETKKEQSKSKSKSREPSAELRESSASSSSVPPVNEPPTPGLPPISALPPHKNQPK